MKITDKIDTFDYLPPIGSGEISTICPACSIDRKSENQKKPCLSWNRNKNTGFCHNCQRSFSVFREPKKEHKKPEWNNKTDLSDNVVSWFEGRKIKQDTLKLMKISDLDGFIEFNYFRDEELINIKYRDNKKNFRLFKDGELIFYNIDCLKTVKECYVVEGEMDCLAFIESGITNCVSVPNGASGTNLEYIDNCIDEFEHIEKIIIATDNDIPGFKLSEELARRFGKERCYKLNWTDCKDANEFIIKHGYEKLREQIKTIKSYPVEGIFTLKDFAEQYEGLLINGLQPGKKIGINKHDELITFETSRILTITGIPSHGKSEYLDWLLIRLNLLHGWKVAYFSPENHPLELHASKISEKLIGKPFKKDGLNQEDINLMVNHIEHNFFFIKPKEDYSIDSILDKGKYLVKKRGIRVLVIDPYNKLEHFQQNGESETKYISRFFDRLELFAQKHDILICLVAHPTKMVKSEGKHEIPTLYNISGSANFYNKTDYGITVYRDFNVELITVLIQKVRFRHLGHVGEINFKYNVNNGRFSELDENGTPIFDNNNYLKDGILKKSEMKRTQVNLPF